MDIPSPPQVVGVADTTVELYTRLYPTVKGSDRRCSSRLSLGRGMLRARRAVPPDAAPAD